METIEQTSETYIPGDDIKVQGGSKSWRFANGKIVRGQEITQEVEVAGEMKEIATGKYPEERTRLTGLLRRVWIYKGANQHGEVHQFEADIETRDGMVHVKCNLLDPKGTFKVGISAANFAWCCLQYEKDAPILIETVKGEPVDLGGGKKGGAPTYVNAFRIKGEKADPIYRPRRDANAPKVSLNDQWTTDLEPKIRAHSAWKEREVRAYEPDENTHLGIFCKECTDLGWPTPQQAPADWLNLNAALFVHEVRPGLASYSDDEWGQVRQTIAEHVTKNGRSIPGLLQAAADRLKATAAPSGVNLDALGGAKAA